MSRDLGDEENGSMETCFGDSTDSETSNETTISSDNIYYDGAEIGSESEANL